MSANKILEKYKQAHSYLLSNLTPENINRLIKSDSTCLRQLGRGKASSSYACEYCELLSHVVSLQKGVPTRINIKTGELSDTALRIEENLFPILLAKRDDTVKELHSKYQSNSLSEEYITVDTWAGSIIIEWILQQIYEEAGIQHVVPSIGFFVCRDRGYRLSMDVDSPISELVLEEDTVLQLLLQLGTALRIVRHYSFSHPNASIESLSFAPNLVTYNYHSVHVNSPFTLYLCKFSSASIEWDGTRLVPYSKGNSVKYTSDIVTHHSVAKVDDNGVPSYSSLFKINPVHLATFMAMRYSGYVFEGYDFYAYLTSLLSWKEFRNVVNNSDRLQFFLGKLFPRKDILRGWPSPEKTGLLTCPHAIANILSGYYLYTDVYDRFLTA